MGHCNRLYLSVGPFFRLSVHQSVCPLCYLLLNHWTKYNQIWCVSYSNVWGVQRQTSFGPASWGQISFNFKYKVNYKIFIPNFVCVLLNERYKTYHTGFSFCRLGHIPGVVFWYAGVPRGSKKNQKWACGISNRRE